MGIPATRLARSAVWVTGVLAVAVAAPAPLGATIALTEGHFVDPFAYCAAVGTVGAPDARYTGPAMPDAVARGLKAALALPADAPSEPLLRNSVWRCMNGKVYACTVGARACPGAGRLLPGQPRRRGHPDGGDRPGHGVRVALRERASRDRTPVARPDAAGHFANIWYAID